MNQTPTYPTLRPRRLRRSANLRRLVRETSLTANDLIYPLFVRPGREVRRPISSMPGQAQLSVDMLAAEAERIVELGIPAVILFGIPEIKDPVGSDNFSPEGIVPQAIRAIKEAAPEMVVISDMCFCEYTDHGHCGIINTPNHEQYRPEL
ncbi:MAG TPA: porphobilinogen synthase, partial [Anaerolineae bacterium]|nr:porphobilinogen synthase [Anaerolineae bacterium]